MFDAIKLTDGDISFDNLGRLVMVEGKASLAQRIKKRLNTHLGDLFYDLSYGIEDFSTMKRTDRYKTEIEMKIKNCLKQDLAIDGVQILDIVKDGKDKFLVKMRIYLTGNTILDLSTQFGVR